MLRTVHLYGGLKKKFGPEFRIDAETPAEIVRALCVQVPGFADHFRKGAYRVLRGEPQAKRHINAFTFNFALGAQKEIHIIPAGAAAGRTGKAIGKILLGAVMIGAAFATGGASLVTTASGVGAGAGAGLGGASFALSTSVAFTGVMGFAAKIGLMMALGGIASLVSPKPKAIVPTDSDQRNSFLFSGPVNVGQQGHVIPVIYGRIRAGTVVVSAGINTEEIPYSAFPENAWGTPGFIGSPYGRDWLFKGGKGGAGANAGKEDPNTLQSTATARVIDLLGEGEIGGLVNGLKSVFLNDVPVQNDDDTFNFKGFVIEERVGLPDDTPLPGFPASEAETDVSVQVVAATPIVRAIIDSNVNEVRVTVRIPALFKVNDKDGSISGSTVQIAIDVQESGGSYVTKVSDTISGKNNSIYERSYRIPLTGNAPWNIRMRRITADSTSAKLSNDTYFGRYTEIINAKLTYPDAALMGITVDAKQFGTQIPNRSYEVYGLKIKVPTNYDPMTRAYATSGPGTTGGVWDGTFKVAWTDNPAWVLYDLITNSRYGLGARIDAASLDKWALYEIAQYCDELIDDGFGGTEPRYTVNTQIAERGEAYDLLATIVSSFRGMVYWGANTIGFSHDHDDAPAKVVTPANVIDGNFEYGSDSLKSRHSVAMVTWNDPEIGFRPNIEVIEDPELIAKYGYITIDATAFGCTSRGLAHRTGRWLLDTEKYGTEVVSYKVSFDNADVRPGQIIEIQDPEFTTERRGGRLTGTPTTTAVTLDSEVVLLEAQTYTLTAILSDGSLETRTVSNSAGTHDEITLASAFTTAPLAGAIWSLTSNVLKPRLFKVLQNVEAEPNIFEISAIIHDENKFARIERGMNLPPNAFTNIPSGSLLPPPVIDMYEFLYREGDATLPGVMVSWIAPDDPRVTYYQLQVRRPDEDDFTAISDTTRLSEEVRNSVAGIWVVRVRSCDYIGNKSAWMEYEETLLGAAAAIPTVDNLVTVKNDSAFTTVLRWDFPEDERPFTYQIKYAVTDDYENATILGEVSANEYVISRVGFYWIDTKFGLIIGDTPAEIEVEAADLPEATWSGIVDDGGKPEDGATRNNPRGTWNNLTAYDKGDFVTHPDGDKIYIAKIAVPAGTALSNTTYWSLLISSGGGAAGQDAIYAFLTNEAHNVATDAAGNGGSYTGAGGTMRVFDGISEQTSAGSPTVVYSVVGSPSWITINSSGVYTVSDPGADSANATIRCVYGGITFDLTYSITKSKQGAAGSAGTPAKLVMVSGTGQAFTFNASGVATPGGQTITLTAATQGTTGGVTWTKTGSSGSTGAFGSTSTTQAVINLTTFGANDWITVTATSVSDGSITDKFTIYRLTAGATGTAAITGFLTNEAHTVPALVDGTVPSWTGVGGQFKVYDGITDVTGSATFSVVTDTVTYTLATTGNNAARGVYTVTGIDSGDVGTITFRAVYNSVTIDKTFVVTKSKTGATGAASKTLVLISDRQTITYDTTGALAPASQDTVFTVNKQNTTGTVTWTATTMTGTAITPISNLLAVSGDTATMTAANFELRRGATLGVIVTASITDGTTFTDKISVLKVQDGARGPVGGSGANLYHFETGGVISTRVLSSSGITECYFGRPDGGSSTPGADYKSNIMLADIGVRAGDVISAAALMAFSGSSSTINLRLRFVNAAGSDVTLSGATAVATPQTALAQKIENITVPAGAVAIRLSVRCNGGTGTLTIQEAMVNRGEVAVPYVYPTRGATNANQNLLNLENVRDSVSSTSPFNALYLDYPLLTTLGVAIGDVVSFSADVTSSGDPWRLELRARDASSTVLSTVVNGVYSSANGRRVLENFVIPATAVRLEVVARRESGTGSLTVTNQMLNRGPTAAQFAAPYEPGATVGATLGDNIVDSYGNPISGADVLNANQRAAVALWRFNSSINGWTPTQHITATTTATALQVATTGIDPQLTSPAFSISGAKARYVRVLLRAPAGLNASGRAFVMFYGTTDHAVSGSYYKSVTAPEIYPTSPTLMELLFDMHDLTAGGTDWLNGTITSLRFDPGSQSGVTFFVEEIALIYQGTPTEGAPGGTFIDNMPVEQYRLGTDTDLWETFAPYKTSTELLRVWAMYTGAGELSFVPTTDTGGQALLCGNNSGNDMVWMGCLRSIPYSPEDLYEVTADIECVTNSTDGRVYVGVNGFAADGVTMVNTAGLNQSGSQHYVAASSVAMTTGQRRVFRGYMRGFGASSVAPTPSATASVHANVRRIAPMFITSYDSKAGQYRIHSMRLRKVEDLATVPKGNYNAGVTYRFGETVVYGERTFMSIQNGNTGNTPPSSNTSNSWWMLIGGKGDTGADGADGTPGFTLNVTGNAQKVSGLPASLDCPVTAASWGHGAAYSSQVYVNGASLWFNTPNNHAAAEHFMVGLNDTPSSASSYTDIDHALYFYYSGPSDYRISVYESGVQRTLLTGGSYRPWDGSKKFGITYDGNYVRYWEVSGSTVVKLYESVVGGNKPYGLDVSCYSRMSLANIAFTAAGVSGRDAVVFHQDATPGSPVVGDTWATLTTPKIWRRWNGSTWVQILGDLAGLSLIADSAYIADGIILNAKIGNLQVDSAKIANLTVGTAKITDGAVTNGVSFYNNSDIALPATGPIGGTSTNLGSVTLTTTGKPLFIATTFTTRNNGGASYALTISVVRVTGGVNNTVRSNWGTYVGDGVARFWSLNVTDEPPAGTHTYQVWVSYVAASVSGIGSNRSLYVVESKK